MKKHYLLGVVLLSISACSTDDVLDSKLKNNFTEIQKTRSVEEAVGIAQKAATMLDRVTTRSADRMVDASDIQYVLAPATRGNTSNDTLLYVVNYADGKGFAVISASKNAEGLLAVTEKGNYRTEESIYAENKGFTDFMEWAREYNNTSSKIEAIHGGENEKIELVEHKIVVDTVSKDLLEKKVIVQWGQTGVEGTYAPNRISGCSNTAMAQIMSYFGYPSMINITYPGATIQSQVLDWAAMREHKTVHYKQYCTATTEAHEAIAQLLRQLGEMNGSSYNTYDTSTPYSAPRSNFIKLRYQVSSMINYQNESLFNILNTGKLIYMRGEDSDAGGHAWVIDGGYRYTTHATEWTKPANQIRWTLLNDYGEKTSEYLHINWGWDGNCNGLFILGNLAPGKGNKYDNTGYNSSSDNFATNSLYFTIYK